MLPRRASSPGTSVLVEARRLGKRSGVPVRGLTRVNARPELEIARFARPGSYDLLVIGTSLRKAEKKFLGPRTAALLRNVRMPVLVIAR
jgi:nucleotide-binding universal stress UspA family protein